MPDIKYFFSWWVIRVFLFNIVLAGSGVALIAYEMSADLLQLRETKLEAVASYVGPLLTLVGVALTAITIYFPTSIATKPSPESYFTAPVVILGCLVAVGALYVYGDLPENILNGFSLLGLAGALFRLQPNPQRAAQLAEAPNA
ncbi:MAG: hypothetical protein ABL864_10325 [Terricaulis sp.]